MYRPRRRASALALLLLCVLVAINAQPMSGAASAQSSALASEALLADFQSEAFARGALGFYLDERSGEMVVVVPVTRTASFRLPLPPPGTAVRQKDIMVDPDELDRALARLGERAPELTATGDRSLAYYFDARLGKIAVLGTIDTATMVEVVGDAFDVVEYRAGVGIVPTSRSWMQPPFSGGAQAKRVGSVNTFDCTTGFTGEEDEYWTSLHGHRRPLRCARIELDFARQWSHHRRDTVPSAWTFGHRADRRQDVPACHLHR